MSASVNRDGPGHGAAGTQMPLAGIEPHGAAAGKHVDRLVVTELLVELRIDGFHQRIDLRCGQRPA